MGALLRHFEPSFAASFTAFHTATTPGQTRSPHLSSDTLIYTAYYALLAYHIRASLFRSCAFGPLYKHRIPLPTLWHLSSPTARVPALSTFLFPLHRRLITSRPNLEYLSGPPADHTALVSVLQVSLRRLRPSSPICSQLRLSVDFLFRKPKPRHPVSSAYTRYFWQERPQSLSSVQHHSTVD